MSLANLLAFAQAHGLIARPKGRVIANHIAGTSMAGAAIAVVTR